MSINFNSWSDPVEYKARVKRLATFLLNAANKRGVCLFNLQEVTYQHMNIEIFRFKILKQLRKNNPYWTATSPAGRDASSKKYCLFLMTFFNASVFHLAKTKNVNLNIYEYESLDNVSISHTSFSSCSGSETTCPRDLHKYKRWQQHKSKGGWLPTPSGKGALALPIPCEKSALALPISHTSYDSCGDSETPYLKDLHKSKDDSSSISHTSSSSCSGSETTCPRDLHKYKKVNHCNALLCEFAIIAPPYVQASEQVQPHPGGTVIRNEYTFINVNVHQPWRDDYKLVTLDKLLKKLSKYYLHPEYFVMINGDFNSFVESPEKRLLYDMILKKMTSLGKLNCTILSGKGSSIYELETVSGKRTNTTFIGTEDNLRDMMNLKLVTDEQIETWLSGNGTQIKEVLNKEVNLLDWCISRNTKWCKVVNNQVVAVDDFPSFGVTLPNRLAFEQGNDIGKLLTDHLPLLTNLQLQIDFGKSVASVSPGHSPPSSSEESS